MPKYPTYPYIFDSALQLKISNFKQDFKDKFKGFKTVTWRTNGKETGKIQIFLNFKSEQPFLILDYSYRGEPRKYKINLVSMPSNLGKGEVWFFICPKTGLKCRKLYCIQGYFYHRKAFKSLNCMYQTQTESKTERQIEKKFGHYCRIDKYYSELYQKHFKHFYAGKPTKRYLKLKNKIDKAGQVSYSEFMQALVN